MIGGLETYFEATSQDFTSHNDLWLIKPDGAITIDALPTFKCIKVKDNETMYNPNSIYNGVIPAATDAWQVYTPNNHECGS